MTLRNIESAFSPFSSSFIEIVASSEPDAEDKNEKLRSNNAR